MEPFKNLFSRELIAGMGRELAAREPGFDRDGFVAAASVGLEELELKARAAQITRALERHLPVDFADACALMLASLEPVEGGAGLRGWAVMPMADFVAARGLGDFDRAMGVLAEMTKRFSAEFAVRPFILHDPGRAMGWLHAWAGDPDEAVRRLASEGSRPRLPWGVRLDPFVRDPAPLIPLLTRLRDDRSETVRRSVANSLNDIAKDHADLVAEIARDWLMAAPPERARLVRHACRTLVKRGHAPTLAALGYRAAAVVAELAVETPEVIYGGALAFTLDLRDAGGFEQRLVVDYAIHHRRANGASSPKVFKWTTLTLPPGGAARLRRRHAIRPITTRRYYDGEQRIEVLVNGAPVESAEFELKGVG